MTSHSRPPSAHPVVACLLALAFAACGFHIRGSYNIPPEITPIAVEGSGGVAAELRENLRRNDIALADAADAASRIAITDADSQRRVLSVDSSGKVDEYELVETVTWHLDRPGSEMPLIPSTTMQAYRDYRFDRTAVLGSEDEEDLLIDDMRSDLATQILFRLQAWRPETAD